MIIAVKIINASSQMCDRVLNVPQILNMGSEYTRVVNMLGF